MSKANHVPTEATMVRNAGGRVFDAIRTLAVLQTIGAPGTIVVMHHTGKSARTNIPQNLSLTYSLDCGMTHFHDDQIKNALGEIAPQEKERIETMTFGEIKNSIEDSVRSDVAMLKASPLIKNSTQIIGLAYDINTGILAEVTDATNEDKSSL